MSRKNKPARRYAEEYIKEAVRLAQSLGTPEAAERLGVPYATLSGWRRRSEAKEPPELVNLSAQQPITVKLSASELEAENLRLRKELADARLDLEILGKATAYFAKRSR